MLNSMLQGTLCGYGMSGPGVGWGALPQPIAYTLHTHWIPHGYLLHMTY